MFPERSPPPPDPLPEPRHPNVEYLDLPIHPAHQREELAEVGRSMKEVHSRTIDPTALPFLASLEPSMGSL